MRKLYSTGRSQWRVNQRVKGGNWIASQRPLEFAFGFSFFRISWSFELIMKALKGHFVEISYFIVRKWGWKVKWSHFGYQKLGNTILCVYKWSSPVFFCRTHYLISNPSTKNKLQSYTTMIWGLTPILISQSFSALI